MDKPTPTKYAFWDLSTAVIPQSELDVISYAPPQTLTYDSGVSVAVFDPADLADDAIAEVYLAFPHLLAVLRAAVAEGVRWVHIDSDAVDTVPGLPVFYRSR